MTKPPRDSALSLLKKYEAEARLLSDEQAREALSDRLAREEEGTLPTPPQRVPKSAPAATHLAPREKEFFKDFALEQKTALCLSGVGFKAMLFHAGALLRLNDAGVLSRIAAIAAVSGGAAPAALLGLKWPRLDFDSRGVARNLLEEVVTPLRRLAGRTVNVWPTLWLSPFIPGFGEGRLVELYRDLLGDATLQDLPDTPRFSINALNINSGTLWRFRKEYMSDYRVGMIRRPKASLAKAVAASSAVIPFFVHFQFDDSDFEPSSGLDLQKPPFTTDVVLTDGGLYDSLAIETVWKRYRTVLVSDGSGGGVRPDPMEASDVKSWVKAIGRSSDIVFRQVKSLYKRQLLNSFVNELRDGAYWGLGSNIADYELSDAFPCPAERTAELAALPSTLTALEPTMQERLVNWGYAVCDAALRRHVNPELPRPAGLVFPDAG